MNVKSLGVKLSELLGLGRAPVAITFRATAPAGVARVERAGPAGCAYWKLAGEGQVFYTEAADHYNCPIGAYTHGVDLPAERGAELQQVVGTMVGLEYIRMEEVPAMPRRTEPFGVAVYAPLAEAPVDPDVVLVRGDARQIMLVAEAARASSPRPGRSTFTTCAPMSPSICVQYGPAMFWVRSATSRPARGASIGLVSQARVARRPSWYCCSSRLAWTTVSSLATTSGRREPGMVKYSSVSPSPV